MTKPKAKTATARTTPAAAPTPAAETAAPTTRKARTAAAGEFPKMLYGPRGAQAAAADPDDQVALEKKGFVEHPDDVVEPKKKKKKDGDADTDDE